MHVAEKARDAGCNNVYGHRTQTWHASDDEGYIYTQPDGLTVVTGPFGGLDREVLNHVLRNNPDVIMRRCEADLRTLDRHKPELIKTRSWCKHCERLWPCVEFLDRAAAYGVPVEEAT